MKKISSLVLVFIFAALFLYTPHAFAKEQMLTDEEKQIGEDVSALIENIDGVQKAAHAQAVNTKSPSVTYKPSKTVKAPKYDYKPVDVPNIPVVYPEEETEKKEPSVSKVVVPKAKK